MVDEINARTLHKHAYSSINSYGWTHYPHTSCKDAFISPTVHAASFQACTVHSFCMHIFREWSTAATMLTVKRVLASVGVSNLSGELRADRKPADMEVGVGWAISAHMIT